LLVRERLQTRLSPLANEGASSGNYVRMSEPMRLKLPHSHEVEDLSVELAAIFALAASDPHAAVYDTP
jgi:hypothetical protein